MASKHTAIARDAAGLLGDDDVDALVVVLELLLGLARLGEIALAGGGAVPVLALNKEPADGRVDLHRVK